METSPAGYDLIRRHEGCRLVAYMDSVGKWTIGYGSTVDVAPGMKITITQAEDRLKLDVQDAERCVNDCVSVPLEQHEFDALVSFTFNLGCGSLRKSTLLRLLNAGDKEGAGLEFRKWVRAGEQTLAGLIKRRYEEQKLFESA